MKHRLNRIPHEGQEIPLGLLVTFPFKTGSLLKEIQPLETTRKKLSLWDEPSYPK